MNAIRWLSAQAQKAGARLDLVGIQNAEKSAWESGGSELHARREQARHEHAELTAIEVKKLRAAIRSLRGIEHAERGVCAPRNLRGLSEAMAGIPGTTHWGRLTELERAVEAFAEEFRASPYLVAAPGRGRGEKVSNTQRLAVDRYVAAFFETSTGHPGAPRELVITEIALGRAPRCTDAGDYESRCKRWSKVKPRLK
jgi:hypothetical protein